jgi:Phytanoyl-CoA dioxygenase (PhyH)
MDNHGSRIAASQLLALRAPLDDSTAGNGPLRVVPGTHTLGVLSDGAIDDLANEIRPLDCVCPKAGVVARRGLMVHASSMSQIAPSGGVLDIEYAASESMANPLELAAP